MGIKGIKRDLTPEIESPYRKKKTGGLMKLKLNQDDSNEEDKEDKVDHRFD